MNTNTFKTSICLSFMDGNGHMTREKPKHRRILNIGVSMALLTLTAMGFHLYTKKLEEEKPQRSRIYIAEPVSHDYISGREGASGEPIFLDLHRYDGKSHFALALGKEGMPRNLGIATSVLMSREDDRSIARLIGDEIHDGNNEKIYIEGIIMSSVLRDGESRNPLVCILMEEIHIGRYHVNLRDLAK